MGWVSGAGKLHIKRRLRHVSAMSPGDNAYRLTGVIHSPVQALDKLAWNYTRYMRERSKVDLGRSQGFALIDYSTAACAIHAWCCSAWRTGGRAPSKVLGPGMPEYLSGRVRWSGALRSISNTSKHANLSDTYWPGGLNVMTAKTNAAARHRLNSIENGDDHAKGEAYLDLITSGDVWGESVLVLDGQSADANKVVYENCMDWHDIVDEFFDGDKAAFRPIEPAPLID